MAAINISEYMYAICILHFVTEIKKRKIAGGVNVCTYI